MGCALMIQLNVICKPVLPSKVTKTKQIDITTPICRHFAQVAQTVVCSHMAIRTACFDWYSSDWVFSDALPSECSLNPNF